MPTSAAEAAVGRDDESADWQLRPGLHASQLPAEAGALRRVLEREDIKRIVHQFETADAKAVHAQRRYKRIGRLSLYAATLATVIGALFILPFDHWLSGPLASLASTIQVLGLATAFLASRLLSVSSPFDTWMKARAEAEIARIELFEAVASSEEATREGELALLPLQLEYFRRYQLAVQQRYYGGRGAQHKAAAWRNNRWLGASMAITVVSVAIGTLAAIHAWHLPVMQWLHNVTEFVAAVQPNRIVLGLGTVASALYGLGVARSLMDLDERNASRFLTTAENLKFLTATALSQAREAAKHGNADDVLAFITRVNDQVSSEHREWLLLSSRETGPGRLLHVKKPL